MEETTSSKISSKFSGHQKSQGDFSVFTKVIGNTPKTRVLEFLIEGRELDHSISDIAEGAGIGRTTLFRILGNIVSAGIVKHTRDIGNARLYKLNMDNKFVLKLVELFDTLVIEPLDEEKEEVKGL